ncbi:hypothetical protein B0H67DRAFT_464226, partial [Lasiosphaeris hirsuta]
MDPITSIGLASAIFSFITFTKDLIKGAILIHESLDGSSPGDRTRESLVKEMKLFCDKLLLPPKGNLKAALRGKVHEADIQRLEATLGECREQLHFRLTQEMRDAEAWEWLQGNLSHLRQGVHILSIDTNSQCQLRQLLSLHDDALNANARGRILRSLEFEGMRERNDRIEDAHVGSFEWMFEGGLCETGGGLNPPHLAARKRFTDFMSLEGGIFHISGKLGSGKSTLMKFLYGWPETRIHLEKWAGDRTLIFERFFFWKLGPMMQNSLAGLLRSLLYDILKSCPSLIPTVMPQHWELSNAMPWHDRTVLDITQKEIKSIFERLIEYLARNPKSSYCFCFFIDGLDEYRGTRQHDHRDMVELLQHWANTLPDCLKMFVSSREDNVFMNAFSAHRRIRLHELTIHDMEGYVEAKLRHLPNTEEKDILLQQIPARAQGIFLWVTLVTRMMRDSVEAGAEARDLVQLLNACPQELVDLFRFAFASATKQDRRRAFQVMAMLSMEKEYEDYTDKLHLTLHGMSFLDEYDKDSGRGLLTSTELKGSAAETRTSTKSKDYDAETKMRIESAGKKLRAWCKGLVESIPYPTCTYSSFVDQRLDYAHRSVRELLDSADMRADMARNLEGFDTALALSTLIL